MEFVLDQKDEFSAVLTCTAQENDYQTEVESTIKNYAKSVQMKGYRPGKAPLPLIKKLYGKSVLMDTVIRKLQDKLTEYLRDNKIQYVGDPIPYSETPNIDWDNQKDFVFQFKIGTYPDFEISLHNLTTPRYEITVTEENIQKSIDEIRQSRGKREPVETSEKDDSLMGKLRKITTEENNAEEKPFFMPSKDLKEEFKDRFVGLQKGSKINIDVKNIADWFAREEIKNIAHYIVGANTPEELATMEGEYEFEVETIDRFLLPELNEELYTSTFGEEVTTEEAFKEKITAQITENYERESKYFFSIQIKQELIEKTSLQLPHEFLKEWLYTINEEKVAKEDIEREYDSFARETKWSLIRRKLAEQYEIKIETANVETEARNMIFEQIQRTGQYNLLGQIDEFVQNYLYKQENTSNFQQIYSRLQETQVSDKLYESSEKPKTTITVADFETLVEKTVKEIREFEKSLIKEDNVATIEEQ